MPHVLLAPLVLALCLCAGTIGKGQSVFLDPIFDVVATYDVLYGTGAVGYGTPGGPYLANLHLHVVQPTGPSVPDILPAAIFINGGGFMLPSPGIHPWMVDLARRGYVTLSIDYRVVSDAPPPEIDTLVSGFDPALALAGQSMIPERSNAFAAQINDTKNAIAWLQANAAALHVDPDRLILVGGSSGARVALATGIAESPNDVAGVLSMLGSIPGNEYLLGPGDPALVLVAGLSDPIVPVSGAIALADAADSAGVPYRLYLGDVGHDGGFFFVNNGEGSFYEQSIAFFYEHLGLGLIPGGGTVVPEANALALLTTASLAMFAARCFRRRKHAGHETTVPQLP